MNWINHFLFSFNVLYFLFYEKVSIGTIILFTIIFSIMVDFDIVVRRYILDEKQKDLRTFLQEPFGVIIIGIPLGLLLNYYFGNPYFFMVIIPYVSHIFLDYIAVHNVFMFAPFSSKKTTVGFIKPLSKSFKSLNENYFLILNLIVFGFLVI